jgi:hypothetical protein
VGIAFSAFKRADTCADEDRMNRVPFPMASVGHEVEQVGAMLEEQMRLALDHPRTALDRLTAVDFDRSEPGVSIDAVAHWIESQQDWLRHRLAIPETPASTVSDALHEVSAAVSGLESAIVRETTAAEQRISELIAVAEQRCARVVLEAEQRLIQLATQERLAAQRDAERLLERAAAAAGRTVLDAEEQLRAAHDAVASANQLRTELVQAIDVAQSAMRFPATVP